MNDMVHPPVVVRRSMPFWCVGNGLADPFGPPVLPEIDPLTVCDVICGAAKDGWIEATGFHDDDVVPWDPENPEDDLDEKSPAFERIETVKEKLKENNVAVNTATCNLHGHEMFRNGGLTNPNSGIRELANLKVKRTLRIGHRVNARYFTYWVARDGYIVPVKAPWGKAHDWVAEALNGAHDYIREQVFTNYAGGTIEPKPNEPPAHTFLPTAGHALGFISTRLNDQQFWGVNPELLQHEGMTLLDALSCLDFLVKCGKKLFFLHFGSQVRGQFDNDFPPLVGPEGLKQTVYMFWLLRQIKWQGTVEFDCHMLRSEANPASRITCRRKFIENCSIALAIATKLASRIRDIYPDDNQSSADLQATMDMCGLSAREIKTDAQKKRS